MKPKPMGVEEERKPQPCQRLCCDDLCRGGSPLCGQDFCIGCQRATVFENESLCDQCAEQFHDPNDDDDYLSGA